MVDTASRAEIAVATDRNQSIKHAVSLARQQTSSTNLQPTLALNAFKHLEKQTSDETILQVNDEILREEQAASPLLPTVGLEIEGHVDIATVRELGFPAGQEHVHLPGREDVVHTGLNEIRFNPTRSARIQINMLNNLTQIGILPPPNLPREVSMDAYGVEKPPSLSTHLNFGLAEGITEQMLAQQTSEITAISDAFTVSYVSPERLRERKTKQAWAIKEATPQEKEKRAPKKLFRAELRTGELLPYDTQRSVYETQRVTACWQAYIKLQNRLPMTDPERKLAQLWQKGFTNEHGKQIGGFMQETQKLRNQYGWTPNMPDTDTEAAAKTLEDNPLFKLEMGMIMVDFAKEVDKILAA